MHFVYFQWEVIYYLRNRTLYIKFMQSGMTKSAEEYRARKEQEERERTRKQMEEQAEKRAKTEQSSGWLWDAVKRKRGQ